MRHRAPATARVALLWLFLPAALVWAQGGAIDAAGDSLSPASAQTLLDRGVELGQAGQFDGAKAVLLQGRHDFPLDPRFSLELAGLAYRQEDLRTARDYLHEALRLNPADPYGNDFLGTLYLLDGNLAAALKYWNRVDKPLLHTVRFDPPPRLTPLLRDRTFDVSGGQVFTSRRLIRTQANVDLLEAFSDCRFELAPQPGQQFDLTIRTVPLGRPLQGWIGTATSLLRGLPYQQLSLDFYNLRRSAINLTSSWRWDAQKRRIALQLSGPLHDWRYRLIFDGRQENWDLSGTYTGAASGLTMRTVEAGGDLTRNLSGRLKWTVGMRISQRRFRGAPGGFYFSNGWLSEVRNRFDWLLWDWPERRLRVSAWGMLRTSRVLTGSPSRLISPEGAARAVWFPQAKGDTYTVVAELRTGGIFGNAPLDQLFILGMERDNDLWLRGHVGTRDGRKGSAPMGREYLLSRTEVSRALLHLPLLRIEAGPFFDSGRIADPSAQFGSRGWLYDTGVQAKIAAFGGLNFLAVYGRNLRDGTGVFYTAIRR